MKRFTGFLLVLFLSMSMMFAQTSENTGSKLSIGILGGLNIPQLTGGGDNPLSSNYSSRTGGAFGLTANYGLGTHLSLCMDVLYSSEGGKRDGIQAFEPNANPLVPSAYLYANIDNETVLDYYEIPVMVRYNIKLSPLTTFYIDLGPYIGFLKSAENITSDSSKIYADKAETMPITPGPVSFNNSKSVTSSINPINFGFTGGIGIMHKVGSGDFFIDVRGAYGLTVVQKNSVDGNNHNGNLLVAVGYEFPI